MPQPCAGAFAGASRRVRRLAARGLLRRQALKPGAIINPRDTWPRFDGARLAAAPAPPPPRPSHRSARSLTLCQRCQRCAARGSPSEAGHLPPWHDYWCTVLVRLRNCHAPCCSPAHACGGHLAGGFSMEAQGTTPEGKQQFGYVYSQAYQASRVRAVCRRRLGPCHRTLWPHARADVVHVVQC